MSPYIRFHPDSIAAGAKLSGLYAVSVMATIDARARGFNECIMLDHKGNVAEGPGENIFIVKGKKMMTPDSASILKGLTRATVMQMARDMRMQVIEKKITLRELYEADEAFFTGTATEVAAIGKLNGKKIGTGTLGPVTARVREMYLDTVHGKVSKYKKWLVYSHI